MIVSSNSNSMYWEQSYCPDDFPHCDDHQNSDYLDCDLISCYSGHWSLVLSHHILKQNKFITNNLWFSYLYHSNTCVCSLCDNMCKFVFVCVTFLLLAFCAFILCICDLFITIFLFVWFYLQLLLHLLQMGTQVGLLSSQPKSFSAINTTTFNNNINSINNNNKNRNINNGYTWRSFRPAPTYFCSHPQVEPGNTINYIDKAPTILAMEF